MASANFMGSTYYENGKDVWLTSSLKLKNLSYLLEEMARWCPFRKSNTRDRVTHYFFTFCLITNKNIRDLV